MKKFVISMLLFFPIFVLAQQSDHSVFGKFDSCKDSEIKILKLQNNLQEIILAGTQVKFFLDAAEELRRDMRTRVAGSSQGKLVCAGDFAKILYSTADTAERGFEAKRVIQNIIKNKEIELNEMKSFYSERCQLKVIDPKNGVLAPHTEQF